MDTIQNALKIIHDAEQDLRDLISTAASQQRYDDVKKLAELANALAIVSIDAATETPSSNQVSSESKKLNVESPKERRTKKPPRSTASSKGPAQTTKRRTPKAKAGYPKFVRDGDRLVKVGWSKKNKEEYEHRVPRETVLAFANFLDDNIEENKIFEIDGLFPVTDVSGAEIPGYQVYVIVAWLRELGVFEKKGRDGYLIHDKSVLKGDWDEQWNSLQAKSA